MAPVPLEGLQTPVANNVGATSGLGGPQEGNRGGMISLAMLIDFIIQRTYHELTVLAELLPRKTDMERKIEIYNFATRTRQLFVRLLALVKWANSASKVEKSARIMAFLDKQSLLFVDTADMLARMARETLVQARLPNFHIPAAVEVLTTGTYGRLPACIREKIVPPDPITPQEKRNTLLRLNQVIQHRLVTGNLLPQMRNLKIENGRVIFHVEHEFEVSLTVMGDGPNIPWRLLEINILVEDKETGDGKALVHSLQVQYIHQLIQNRLVDNPQPLAEVYNCLHFFCQSLQLEVLYSQTLRLMRDRLDEHIHVDEYVPGKCLTVSYWRELTIKGKDSNNKDLRSELGYRLTVQMDTHNPARPLAVLHVPSLGGKEYEIADRAIRSEVLSMERLLVHTIYVRTKSRLSDIKLELQGLLKNVECNLQGSPAILSVAVLQPCLRAEQLLITVDTHTGMLQCHVPQYDPPLIPELNNALNGDHSRLPMLITELRFWITQRRCEKTLQHLPATAHEKLPLLHQSDHPITKISRHKMYVQLHRHPNVILIIELKEKENNPCEIDCFFYMAVVKHSSIEDNPNDDTIETEIPKVYLRVQTLIEFDTFVATHGPFTNIDGPIDGDHTEPGSLKRKGGTKPESATRRSKQPAYFIAELAHVVAMCDERLPFVTLANELTKRNVFHQGVQVEANATGLVLKLIQLPAPSTEIGQSPAWHALLKRLLSASIRVYIKGVLKHWMVEFVFYSTPLQSTHPKEQGSRRPIYFQYEMGTIDGTVKTVETLLNDWAQIVHLYTLVHDLSEYLKIDKYSFLGNLFSIKSYNYSKLILCYGPEKGAMVSITWNSTDKIFKLAFGAANNALNAHSLIQEQLEAHLNEHRNLAQIVQLLNETYEPLLSISKLPTIPQLGVHNTRLQVPVQTFTIMAQSTSLIRLAYQGMYCLELRIRGGGLVSLRDGAYSRFDRSNVVDVFLPTQGLKAFLSKYVDESAVFRRRSQSEDDNPPSPVEVEGGFLSHHRGPQSPAGQREPGLRFHAPLTPPSGSNPHTPASPHTSNINQPPSHPGFGSSPATSFNLASPTSHPSNINPSPMPHPSPGSGLVANSPLNPQIASPGGLLSNSSPGPQSTNLPGHSPVSSFIQGGGHTDGSPFPSSQSMSSPGVSNWPPGSPSMPRPSPARPGQSPGHPIMHSPQQSDIKSGHLSRVLPQRSWAGAVPTLLTHEALETLCCPSPHPQGYGGPELAPLERFLGCVYMRRQLHRFIHNEVYLTSIPNTEPGVILFKVTETLQCRIALNPQHLQSLHIKITPLQDHKEVLNPEDLQVLEKFFDTKAAVPPYKPTAMFTFCHMLNVPLNVLKDFIQIMKLELMPGLAQSQGLKWSVQWMLRTAPYATPIVPTGTSGVLAFRSKILFFLQFTRIGVTYPPNIEPTSIVLPLIYDHSTNVTQLAERREIASVPSLTAASQLLKHFSQYQTNMSECSVFPAIRELLMNLTLPTEAPAQSMPGNPPGMQQMPPRMMYSNPPMGGMMGPWYNKIQHQYRLTGEEGPAHKKIFTVTLKLGSEEYEAEGPSIKKAQHLAAAQALAKTELKHPPPKTIRNRGQGQGRVSNPGAVTPTVELNALAMRRGERTTYVIENGNPNSQHQFIPQPPYFQTRYNYNMQQSQPRFDGRRNIRPGHYGYQDNRYYNQYRPGAPHNPGEAITVRLKVGEREYPGQGYSVQAARHDAASKAIEHIKQLGGGQENTTEPQPSSSTAAPAPASAPAPTNVTENASTNTNNNSSSVTTASEPNNNNNNNNAVNINSNGIDLKSPISLVYEIALKRNLNVTFEVLSEKGPPHMKVFVTQCRVGTFQAEGEGNGKKISKKRAAEKMLEELLKLPPMSSLQNLQNPMKRKRVPTKKKTRNLIKVNVDKTVEVTEEINPISRLIQIQQAKKEREPTYEVIEERGAPRRREFVIEASVNGVAYRGVGPNKKIAKRNAAEGLLALLGYGNNNNSTNTKSALKSDKENGEPAPEKGRKVTFVEEKQGEAAATATANNATSSTTTNNSVSNTNQTQSVGGSGGRQLVPGVLLVTEQSAAFPKKENDKTEKPVQNQIKPPSTPVQGVRSKDQLLYLAQLMEIQVQFSDFPKANHETYLTLVSLSTNPPQVCHGEGPTTEASHEKAALEALRVLSELGLDNVVPNKDTSNGSASGESSTTTSPKGNNINQNGVKK